MLPVPFNDLVVPSKLGIEVGKIVPGELTADRARYVAKRCEAERPNNETINQNADCDADISTLDDTRLQCHGQRNLEVGHDSENRGR